MPCPIFRSVSWYWSKETNVESAWYVKHIALVLKNWKTDEEKTWADTLNNTNPYFTGNVCKYSKFYKSSKGHWAQIGLFTVYF